MDGGCAIRAEGLGKRYLIGPHSGHAHDGFRDALTRRAASLLRHRSRPRAAAEPFWALRDVDFTIAPGEVVGVIGRNGAGKSTLLKILSRITEPSCGTVEIRGRVASLLEVGTGFHAELTGRENIFLNGAILGMARAEIRRKFDEIVAFADVAAFLDTPVKRYSSGMYVRLAFAVAAHLEPDILIVDEVLAVGDAEFQKKCLGKMSDVASSGRTVLFVSHNIAAIRALCDTGLYLRNGTVAARGPLPQVLESYASSASAMPSFERTAPADAELATVAACAVHDADRAVIRITMTVAARQPLSAAIDVLIADSFGSQLGYGSLGSLDPGQMIAFDRGLTTVTIEVGTQCLAHGSYLVSIDIANPHRYYYDRATDCLRVDVEPIAATPDGRVLQQAQGFGSILFPVARGAG